MLFTCLTIDHLSERVAFFFVFKSHNIMFLVRFLFILEVFGFENIKSTFLYPLFFDASSYSVFALSNMVWFEESISYCCW